MQLASKQKNIYTFNIQKEAASTPSKPKLAIGSHTHICVQIPDLLLVPVEKYGVHRSVGGVEEQQNKLC